MEIKSRYLESEQQIRYKLIGSRNTKSYRTTNDLVLRMFLNNEYYDDVLKTHNNDFIAYLKLLNRIKNKSFVTPEVVYTYGESRVRSYVRKYILGNSLGDLYPKTQVESLIDKIEELYEVLKSSPEISLQGITAKDMIYTGEDIFLTDFDLCKINWKDNYADNLKLLDKAIFIGLFKYSPESLKDFNPKYAGLVEFLEDKDYHITDYLKEYSSSLKESGKKPKYLRVLENNLILK